MPALVHFTGTSTRLCTHTAIAHRRWHSCTPAAHGTPTYELEHLLLDVSPVDAQRAAANLGGQDKEVALLIAIIRYGSKPHSKLHCLPNAVTFCCCHLGCIGGTHGQEPGKSPPLPYTPAPAVRHTHLHAVVHQVVRDGARPREVARGPVVGAGRREGVVDSHVPGVWVRGGGWPRT